MSQIRVSDRLARDLPWLLAFACVLQVAMRVSSFGWGWDARAYWLAWHGPMYTTAPDSMGAYLYSPAFAQAIWPLAVAPWPAFCLSLIHI